LLNLLLVPKSKNRVTGESLQLTYYVGTVSRYLLEYLHITSPTLFLSFSLPDVPPNHPSFYKHFSLLSTLSTPIGPPPPPGQNLNSRNGQQQQQQQQQLLQLYQGLHQGQALQIW
jgi:hypothetical protein